MNVSKNSTVCKSKHFFSKYSHYKYSHCNSQWNSWKDFKKLGGRKFGKKEVTLRIFWKNYKGLQYRLRKMNRFLRSIRDRRLSERDERRPNNQRKEILESSTESEEYSMKTVQIVYQIFWEQLSTHYQIWRFT